MGLLLSRGTTQHRLSSTIFFVADVRTAFFFFFFFNPIYYLQPSFSLSLPVVTQIRGHIAGSSPPLPTTVLVPLIFIPRRFQLFLHGMVIHPVK